MGAVRLTFNDDSTTSCGDSGHLYDRLPAKAASIAQPRKLFKIIATMDL